jgi:predicted nucleotide-binding protein
MTLDQAKNLVSKAAYAITEERRVSNDTGTMLRLDCGAVVNVWDKGSFNVQGKHKTEVEAILASGAGLARTGRVAISNKIFVVYGHDTAARSQLEAMLRRWGLDPLFLDQLPSEGQTIIEKLENYAYSVNYAVVLATPDDEGHRANRPDEKTFRARQNVVLELGMLLAKLGRSKIAILIKNPSAMERPSDIQGLVYIPFTDNLEKEVGVALAKEMAKQGFNIDVGKL